MKKFKNNQGVKIPPHVLLRDERPNVCHETKSRGIDLGVGQGRMVGVWLRRLGRDKRGWGENSQNVICMCNIVKPQDLSVMSFNAEVQARSQPIWAAKEAVICNMLRVPLTQYEESITLGKWARPVSRQLIKEKFQDNSRTSHSGNNQTPVIPYVSVWLM